MDKGHYEYDLHIQMQTAIKEYEEKRAEFWESEGAPIQLGRSAVLYEEAEKAGRTLMQLTDALVAKDMLPNGIARVAGSVFEYLGKPAQEKAVFLKVLCGCTLEELRGAAGDEKQLESLVDRKTAELERQGLGLLNVDLARYLLENLDSACPPENTFLKLVWERLCIELACQGVRNVQDDAHVRLIRLERGFVLVLTYDLVGDSDKAPVRTTEQDEPDIASALPCLAANGIGNSYCLFLIHRYSPACRTRGCSCVSLYANSLPATTESQGNFTPRAT